MTTQDIDLKHLDISPLNVRKTASPSAADDLKASILAHGLMQNLVVTRATKGKYHVIAGGRRLQALKALQKEGKLPAGHAVACQVVGEDEAAEMSLAENVVRQAMHPADQFEAFARLIDEGQTAEQVAARFGTTVKIVEQRMKLAKVAPALIAEYRAERLTLDALMAFTITDDQARQEAVFERLNDWQKKRPGDIRELLTEQMLDADDKFVKFVGLETYQKAGGVIRTDLFGEDVYLENPELLEALVDEKLKLVEQELVAEGWGWVQVDQERDWKVTQGCGRIRPEPADVPQELLGELEEAEARQRAIAGLIDAADDDDEIDALYEQDTAIGEKLEEIEAKIESFARFDPEQMKSAGCYAYVGYSGKLEIERGLVRRQDVKRAAAEPGNDQPAEKPKGMPDSLKRDLEAYRLGVAQAEIARHPAIAFDLLVFKAAKGVVECRPGLDGPKLRFDRNYGGTASREACGFVRQRMEAIEETLPLAWIEADSEYDQFLAFQRLTEEQKHAILAYCVACTLQPKLAPSDEKVADGAVTAYDLALAQTGANVADYWRPTKENYLGRITKDQLLEIGRELIGGERGDHWAKLNAGVKKGDIADELHRNFAAGDAARSPNATDEQVERLRNWLPKGMAFPAIPVPEPKPAKAKKGKKAA